MYIFEKTDFLYDLFKEKNLKVGSMCTFYERWKQPLNIPKTIFYKQVLDFHRPSKILCCTSRRALCSYNSDISTSDNSTFTAIQGG
jgi:hypothetical protein